MAGQDPIVVMKFGGSSLASVEDLRKVAAQVIARRREGVRVVVVVSAMGKTTNQLLEMAQSINTGASRRELDMLVTAGERISMSLLSIAIEASGLEAISLTGSQSGIITESSHQGARILEVRPYRIQEALESGKIVIVAGYQGVSLDKEVTTLGRGGSDTSAVALAAALEAEQCEIYSDVDGVYSADPNCCPQARLLPELDYESMQALGHLGAKVLNAAAVAFAARAGITIVAQKTGFESQNRTRVSSESPRFAGAIAVAGNRESVYFSGPREQLIQAIKVVSEEQGNIIFVTTGPQISSFIVDCRDLLVAQLERVKEELIKLKWCAKEIGLVSLVGWELLREQNIIEKAELSLKKIDHAVNFLGADLHSLSFVLARDLVPEGMNRLHEFTRE